MQRILQMDKSEDWPLILSLAIFMELGMTAMSLYVIARSAGVVRGNVLHSFLEQDTAFMESV